MEKSEVKITQGQVSPMDIGEYKQSSDSAQFIILTSTGARWMMAGPRIDSPLLSGSAHSAKKSGLWFTPSSPLLYNSHYSGPEH